jgi:hypothetical protein
MKIAKTKTKKQQHPQRFGDGMGWSKHVETLVKTLPFTATSTWGVLWMFMPSNFSDVNGFILGGFHSHGSTAVARWMVKKTWKIHRLKNSINDLLGVPYVP